MWGSAPVKRCQMIQTTAMSAETAPHTIQIWTCSGRAQYHAIASPQAVTDPAPCAG